uniref:Integrase, catalytic region, zinc finger, CCHC-type, peptidase aspartic, catalytic n=1 Tax=Tanacetum cinerariifolium TaxID=118510 RepID=A0A6L2J7M2_TANCI|nr:hypothetical protein [Tanacetum cinerariifolium]
MVFMAQIEKVLSDSEASSSSADEKISEVSYYLSESESESEYETSEYYDNTTNYVADHNDSEGIDKLIRKFNKKIVKCQNRVEKANQQSKYFENQNKDLQDKYDVLKNQTTTFEMNNNELNEQLKELNEQNNDLLAQTKLLKEQLQVKHVVIDTHVECQEKYAKLEAERYEYMIRYSTYFNNDKQHKKQTADQQVLCDKMSVQVVKSDKHTIHMIMPSKDNLYNGQKGIGFENPSYFEKAKDLRPTLYDEKIDRLARSLLIQGLPNKIYSLIDSNKTAKDLCDALDRHIFGSEYGEQDRKTAVLYEYETFKATEGELLLDIYIRYLQVINDLKKCGYLKDNCELNFKFLKNLQPEWKQYATMMRQNKNLTDININALYNILKQNQGDVNDAMGSKKKTVVVTSDPLALIAKKTKVRKSKEKVVVSLDSEGSDADDFSELKKITALLAKAFNQIKFYSKPTNNNLRTSSTSQSANKKQEFVKTDNKKVEKKDDEKKRDMIRVKCYNYKDELVVLAEDQAWMESSSDSDQEINANMVFMAQIKKVLYDSEATSSSTDEKISEVSYYLFESENESEFETSEYYDNSTDYSLFVNNDDDQEIFHDAIESAGENFIENHIDFQKDYDKSDFDHNDSEEKDHLVDKLIRKFNKKIVKCHKHIKKANQQSKDFENQNKDLQDKYDVLNQATTFEINNKELNEQLKELIEMNNDLLAQTKVLKEQLQVKHVVIDTHAECQEKYAKLEAERYNYMIRYSAYFDNEKQHRKQIADQEVLYDKMSVQLVQVDKHVRDLKNTVLEKDFKISELEECMKRKGADTQKESQICCGQFISKIVRKSRVLTEDVLRSLRALVYCIDLDTTTFRELIDSESRLIPEHLQPSVPRVGIPRPPRAST